MRPIKHMGSFLQGVTDPCLLDWGTQYCQDDHLHSLTLTLCGTAILSQFYYSFFHLLGKRVLHFEGYRNGNLSWNLPKQVAMASKFPLHHAHINIAAGWSCFVFVFSAETETLRSLSNLCSATDSSTSFSGYPQLQIELPKKVRTPEEREEAK